MSLVGFAALLLQFLFSPPFQTVPADVLPSSPQASSGVLRAKIEFPAREAEDAELDVFGGDHVRIRRRGSSETVDFDDIQSIRLQDDANISPPRDDAMLVRLVDGTQLHASSIQSADQQLTLAIGSRQLTLATEYVSSIRFGSLSDDRLAEWRQYRDSEASSDTLVVRQPTGALTKIEGIVLGIAADGVQFEFGDSKIPVPFARLAGIRFFTSVGPPEGRAAGHILDGLGNDWAISSLTGPHRSDESKADDAFNVRVRLLAGIDVEIPVAELVVIDLATGSTMFLADLAPLRRTAKTLFDFPVADLNQDSLFGDRRLPPHTIPGSSLGPSLEFIGSGQTTFEIPDGFSKLQGAVEIRPQGDKFTPCTVKILVEGELLWSQRLAENNAPVRFELSVPANQRLSLVVDANSEIPTGDVVRWLAPRLMK